MFLLSVIIIWGLTKVVSVSLTVEHLTDNYFIRCKLALSILNIYQVTEATNFFAVADGERSHLLLLSQSFTHFLNPNHDFLYFFDVKTMS